MISRSLAVVALLLAGATLAQAQPKPTIKGCSGAVQHGNAIACTGSGFGTRPAWARVEISNKSSYDSASHREMCIPSSWSDTSVTCRINRGSFQPGESVYVHVCTNANRCSAGFGPLKVAKDQLSATR